MHANSLLYIEQAKAKCNGTVVCEQEVKNYTKEEIASKEEHVLQQMEEDAEKCPLTGLHSNAFLVIKRKSFKVH